MMKIQANLKMENTVQGLTKGALNSNRRNIQTQDKEGEGRKEKRDRRKGGNWKKLRRKNRKSKEKRQKEGGRESSMLK